MPDDPQRLQYASPPPLRRPPLYSLVLSVLAAMFLMSLGGLLGFGVLAMSYSRLLLGDRTVKLWGIFVFAPVAAVFFAAGFITMLSTVAALRGKSTIGLRWVRWAALLNRVYFAGEQKPKRPAH